MNTVRYKLVSCNAILMLASVLITFSACTNKARKGPFLARRGQSEAVIVIWQESGPFYHWVASEVQHYVRELSGAELPVVTPDALLPQKTLIMLGGPGKTSMIGRIAPMPTSEWVNK